MSEYTWYAIIFLIFIALTSRSFIKNIISILDLKIQNIKKNIDKSVSLKSRAEFNFNHIKNELQKAEIDSNKIIEESKTSRFNILIQKQKELDEFLSNKKAHNNEIINQLLTKSEYKILTNLKVEIIELIRNYLINRGSSKLKDIEIINILKGL